MDKQNSREDLKEGIYDFLNQKSAKILEETDKLACTAENVN